MQRFNTDHLSSWWRRKLVRLALSTSADRWLSFSWHLQQHKEGGIQAETKWADRGGRSGGGDMKDDIYKRSCWRGKCPTAPTPIFANESCALCTYLSLPTTSYLPTYVYLWGRITCRQFERESERDCVSFDTFSSRERLHLISPFELVSRLLCLYSLVTATATPHVCSVFSSEELCLCFFLLLKLEVR